VADAIDRACREHGFFYVSGHGVSNALQERLERAARDFFALPEVDKATIAMARGGHAWRGWFPLEGELTSGQPDRKEGLYLGAELGSEHPQVRAGTPLHGANLFPDQIPELRAAVLEYLAVMTELGHALMGGVALALGLDRGWFRHHLTADPLILFRIFRYPPEAGETDPNWGVAEHTDYGLLTMLRQDVSGGLQVHAPSGWIDAPPIPGTFVCNLGDMLERMTGGRYRSTPHRVRNRAAAGRLSMPFFFDPSFDAEIRPGPAAAAGHTYERWDGRSVHAFEGRYGDYLLEKVSKVFPALRVDVLTDPAAT
jgi:isopenicillin N synthase-like dioxygenase